MVVALIMCLTCCMNLLTALRKVLQAFCIRVPSISNMRGLRQCRDRRLDRVPPLDLWLSGVPCPREARRMVSISP